MLSMCFHHVKGHQKETSNQKWTLPEKLNIDCNAQASQMQPAPLNSPICHNPFTEGGYRHLCIKQQCITQCIQHTLCNVATQQPYFNYLQKKFDWELTLVANTVHWLTLQQTLRWFKASSHCTIDKFIHEWLPLQDQIHVQSASCEHLCPSCHQAAKTSEHFLACQHPMWQQVWKDLHDKLHKHQIHHSVSMVFHDMFAYGLYWGWQAYTNLDFSHLPYNLSTLFSNQEGFGWKQLYYSQLMPLWIALVNLCHPQVNAL